MAGRLPAAVFLRAGADEVAAFFAAGLRAVAFREAVLEDVATLLTLLDRLVRPISDEFRSMLLQS